MRRPFIALVVAISGCASPPELLVSQGRLGYLSDRAHELSATIEAEAAVPRREGCDDDDARCLDERAWASSSKAAFDDVADRRASIGEPLFPERARVEPTVLSVARRADGQLDVRFRVDVVSFARAAEHPLRPWVYPSDATARFSANDPSRLDDESPLAELRRRGDVRLAVVLGQIAAEPGPDDPAAWSRASLERSLSVRGFVRRAGALSRDGLTVVVAGPDEAPLSSERAADRVAAAFADADVVYVNGHARSGLLAKVARAERPSLVFLDLCWSYYLDARETRDRAPHAALFVTDGDVITGSVDNAVMLVDALLAADDADPSYRALLSRMNDAAVARAKGRPRELAEPEVYGVIPR